MASTICAISIVLWVVLLATGDLSPVAPTQAKFSWIKLERGLSENKFGNVTQFMIHDMNRYRQHYHPINGDVSIHVNGSYDPYFYGVYYATIKLGTPPRKLFLQIDTTTDILWLNCMGSSDDRLSGPQVYNSRTAHDVLCSDDWCGMGMPPTYNQCNRTNNRCGYELKENWNGTGTSGYYITDNMTFNTYLEENPPAYTNFAVPITFGCSTKRNGGLARVISPVIGSNGFGPSSAYSMDGIFGFGPGSMSVASQLASLGLTPPKFSLCLSGDAKGGASMAFAEYMVPGMVYANFAPNQSRYNLRMESISVNGQTVPIDPSCFATSATTGTIIDTSQDLAYLAGAAYGPFLKAINNSLSDGYSVGIDGIVSYNVTSSVDRAFPKVSLNFEGGAFMVLDPRHYLFPQKINDTEEVWCMGFQKSDSQSLTILGGLVLYNKAMVFDLARQRIGWAKQNCSIPEKMNVTVPTSNAATRKIGRLLLALFAHIVMYMVY